MVMYLSVGSKDTQLSDSELCQHFTAALESLGPRRRVCVVPPDYTRFHSKAGVLTQAAYRLYRKDAALKDVIPALGTHAPVTEEQRVKMFGDVPKELFRVHDWRNDVVKIGEVPADMVKAASDGKVNEPWPAQLNKLVWEGEHDLVLSIGQVVPHEVLGMANYNKNLFVGVGGADAINFSHFIGAVYGMERMMGRADNPLRRILNYASDKFLKPKLPLIYALTVVARDDRTGQLVTKGLFVGDDVECFHRAAALSLEVNFEMLEEPLHKVVVYLDPDEFHSTWLGNKAIYRTRMAIADGGELIVLAPGVREFGEDPSIDKLIRKHGYRTTPEVLAAVKASRDLMKNLGAAAHLMHGSTEKRFSVTYCPGHLTKDEIEGVGYKYADLSEMTKVYDPKAMQDGWNTVDGERIYYISNPAVGLWAYRKRFEDSNGAAKISGDTADRPVTKRARIEPWTSRGGRAQVIRLKIAGEAEALQLDKIFRSAQLNPVRAARGFVSLTRQLCKSEWVFEVSLVFDGDANFQQYLASATCKEFRSRIAEATSGVTKKPVYWGARVYDEFK